eukprot:6482036-Amphidinium_carterae.1
MPADITQKQVALVLAVVQKMRVVGQDQRLLLKRLIGAISFMPQDLPMTQLVTALLEDTSPIPPALRQWLNDPVNEKLSQLVLHVVVLLTANNGSSESLALFNQILAHGGAALRGLHVPANVGSVWLAYMRHFPPAFHVYTCPNRHMYVTDA